MTFAWMKSKFIASGWTSSSITILGAVVFMAIFQFVERLIVGRRKFVVSKRRKFLRNQFKDFTFKVVVSSRKIDESPIVKEPEIFFQEILSSVSTLSLVSTKLIFPSIRSSSEDSVISTFLPIP
jgi:hypothetical protein